jgi:hypothetical protein
VVHLRSRVWFERIYMYWLHRKWRGFMERHELLGILLVPFITLTFILATGLLLLVDSAVNAIRRAVRIK